MLSCVLQFVFFSGITISRLIRLNHYRAVLKPAALFFIAIRS